MKLQRNAVQDVDLIDARARSAGRLEAVREELTRRLPVTLWEEPPPVVRELPPEDWDSRNLTASQDDNMAAHADLDALWWVPVRLAALGEEVER